MAEIRHIEQFEYYYELGSTRSYQKVADNFNIKKKTVDSWGRREKWQEEVKLRDLAQIKKNRKESLLYRQKKANDYKKIVDLSLATYIEKLKKGKIEIKTVKDLDILLKLEVFLDAYVIEGEGLVIGETLTELNADNKKEENDSITIKFDLMGGVDCDD